MATRHYYTTNVTSEEQWKKYVQEEDEKRKKRMYGDSTQKSTQSTFNKPQAKQTSQRNSVEEEVDYANTQLDKLSDDEKKSLDKVTTANKVLSALQGLGSVTTRDNPFGVQNRIQSEAIEQKKQGEEEFKSKTGVDDQAYQKYVQYAREVQNAEDRKQRQEQIKKDTTGGNKVSNAIAKGTLDVADLVVSPWAGLSATAEGTLGRLGYADQNAPVDTNSANYMMQNFTTDVEKNRTDLYNEEGGIVDNTIGKLTNKDLKAVDSFLYGTGMSMGKAAISMAMGGEIAGALGVTGKAANAVANLVTLPQFGTSSYATTLQQAQERGLSQKQAQATAIVSGAAEMVFEKLSVDHFWDIYKNSGAKAARSAIVNILAQSGIEGSEEVFTSLANAIADDIINKGESENKLNYQKYIDDGDSESEAKKKAAIDFGKQIGQDFLGGAISGAIFGGFGASANHHQATQYSNAELGVEKDGKAVYTGQEVADKYAQIRDAIPEIGATNGQTKVASELKQTADLLRIKAQNNQTISQKERNSFYQMQSFLGEQYEADDNYRKIVDEYKKTKVEDNKAQGFANFNQITNEIMTQKVTNPEMPEEAQVETELRELSPMDNMLVEESEGKSPAYISGVKGEEFAPSNIDEEIAYNEGQQYRTQRKSEENNPKTATAIRGNEKFKIASIKNVKGEPYITTDSGVTMPLSEASIVNDNVQTLYNNASKHDNAQAYIDGYNPNIPVKAYSSAMENVYNYARLHGAKGTFDNAIKNEPYKDKIDKASLKAMYEEGLKDTQTKSKKVTKSGKKAQNKVTDENNRLSKNGRKLMKAISDKLGVDVEIVDNQMTVDGKTVNGFFDVDNNKIVLNPDGQNVFKTLIHEVMGEMSEAYNSEKMDELQLAIIDYELAHNPKKFNDTVENYRQAYIKHEGSKSYREAADEYVNDILVELFNDEQGMKDFANFIADKQSVKETFLEFIDNIVSAIKELMGDASGSRFKDDIEAMQRLRKMALDTWQTAIDNKLALENGETELKQASSLDVRNSIEPENNYKISENGEVLITEDGREIPIIKTGDVKVGNKKQNARAQALVRETLRQLRGTSVIIKADDRKVYFVKQTEKEYSMSKTTMNLENKERSAKYSAANKIKTIVENAKNPTWKPDENNKHGESAQRGWTYYDVDFIVTEDGKNFEQAQGRLVIRMGVDGRDSVYDIDNIKIETISTSITSPSRQPLSTSSIAPEAEKSTATGSGNDIRKSLEVDTEGRELNDSKKEFFKNSKIVDKDGRLLVLYHGTPVGGFNEFRNPLNFFTPNRAYAERYANQDSKTGEIYEVYLNVEKPFDITNPEDRQIFIDEYVKGGWSYSIDPSLSDREIAARIKDGIDWTEADNLKEFLEENDYDYDGLILNEGGDFEYGDRDNSYVIFESRQAKRVDNENPTQDADIRFSLDVPEEESKTLIAIHNLSAEKMMQSLDLGGFPMPSIAVTTTELGHTNYGDVSVLFGKDTVDPTKSRKNKIYGGDAWTPTVPRLESKVNEKVAEKIRLKIDSLVDNDEQRALGFLALDNDNLEEQINNRRGDVIDAYKDKRGMKYAFLKDNGIELDVPQTDKRLSNKFDNDQVLAGTKVVKNLKQAEDLRMNTRSYENNPEIVEGLRQALNDHFRQKHENALKGTKLAEKDLYDELSYSDFDQLTVGLYKYYRDGITQEMDSSAMRDAIDEEMKGREKEYEKWLSDLFDGIVEKQGLRNNKELFTYTGNRRSWDSLHDEYNLDNIVKIMSQQDAKGEAGFFSVSKIQALATKNFKNLSEVRKAKNQLRMETEEEHEARVDEQSERFTEICDEIKDKRESNSFIAFGRAADAIADAVSKYHTVQGIDRELREWTGLNIQDDTAQKVVDLMKDIAENPTGYFEAKPQRAVELSEIERVIVPHLEKDLIAVLDEKNIPYTTYKAGDEEARKAAVNSVPEIRFSIEVDSEGNKLSREQQRYFADSKVVDDQGRLKVMYHGTEEATFTKFDLGKMDDGRSIFLTDSKIVAQTYSADDSIVDPYNIHDLETEEGAKKFFEDTDFELRKTEDGYEIYDNFNDDVAWKNESLFGLMMQYAYDMGMYNLNGGIYKTYVNLVNPLIVDAEDKNWDDLEFEIDGGVFNTTRDVAEYAYITGYDGVIFKGLIDLGQYSDYADMDGSSDVAVAFNPNQVKSTNNLHPTEDEDIRYSVEVDTNGNKLSKDQVEYFADSKVRDGNGNLKVMYHGTRNGGFTIFNPAYSDDRRSLFFSDNKEVAKSYTRAFDEDVNDFEEGKRGLMVYPVYLNVTNPMVVDAKGASWGRIQNGKENEYVADRVSVGDYTFLSQEDLKKFDRDTDILKINKAYNEAKKNGTAEYDGEEYDSDELLEMLEGFDKEYAKYFMNHRTNITAKEFFDNPQKYGWWDLYSLQTNYDSNGPSLEEIKEYADYDYMEAVQTFKDHIDEEIAEGYFDYDFYNDFEFGVMPQTGDNVTERDLHNTRWYSKKAQEEGYDGVIFKNLDDSIGVGENSTIVVAFDSNQVKSIENKTPTKDADIRYSIEVDTDGKELSDDQKKYFANSKVVDNDGRLKVMYHGTWEDFNEFIPNEFIKEKNGYSQIKGYFSEDEDYSQRYGNTKAYYLNITNPLELDGVQKTLAQWKRFFTKHGVKDVVFDSSVTGKAGQIDTLKGGEFDGKRYYLYFELFDSAGIWYGDGNLTEQIAKAGYDGIKSNDDFEKAWMIFDSNQAKLTTNEHPSESADIRYSLALDDIKKRAKKRFSFDQADQDLLDSLAEGQSYNKVADDTMAQILSSINNLYKGQEVGAKSIQTVAKEIKEYTGSTISTSKLEEQLKTLFDYMQRADNELNTGEMFDMFKIVAGDVVDKMASEKVDDSFRDFMRTETFRLTDDQKKEVAHVFGSYDNFRKKYFGTLNIRNDATSTLDGLWNEITEQSFYGLDRDTPEAEQPIALVDFLDAMKDQPINNFGASFDELSTDVAIRILEKYFAAEQEAMTNKALLDNPSAKKALDDARANMRKADQEFRKQVKEKYDEEVARLTKERDDAQSSSQFFYNRARDLENKLANASNEEDKKAIRKLQSELDKKEKALIKAKAQSKAPLSAYQEQLGRADEKRKIMQISNRLMKMVYAPTEKLHMPEEFREPIGEFLNGIDFITHRGDINSIDKMRWQTRMDNLRHYLSELSSKSNATQNELNLAELLEDELLEDMEKFTRDHAEDKKISRMSKDDLHKLYGILTRLSATVSKTNETFANSVYADMTKLNVDSYNELVEMNDRNVGNGVMQSIKDFFGKSLEDPITYFSLLGKAPKSLFDGLLKGFDRRTSHIKEAQEYMEFLPKDAYKWEKEKHTFVINGTYDVKGEELELTTTQIMTLYELNKRKAASHHLFSGGIKALNTHLLGYTSQSRKAYHLTETDLKNIFGVLTQEQIDAADKMQEFMSTNCADWGNNVSMTLWGYKKFTEKDYFPMKVDSDSRATSNKDTNVPNFYSNKNISASKELKEMADNPLLIGDIFDVFTEHVADMATYDGMVLPQMDAMRWFNYKVKEVDGQGRNFISGTKQEINRIYGQAGLSYFTNLMLGINGAEPKARGVRLQNALIGRYKKVAVTAKIRVAIQQPTAFVRAYDEMDGKYLTKALATTNPVKYSKIAKQNSNLAWWKGQGYYESYLGKGLKEIIVGKNPVIQKAEDFEGWGAQTMDDLTWGVLYHASELEVKDKHPDLKGKEFTDAVVERFEDLVSKTQVVDTMLHRTDIMRSQGDLTKLATSFMTEPLKTYNMLMRSVVGAARDKDKKALRKLIRTLFVYVANAAILSMVTTTWDALRKDDDETKYTDKWLELYGQEAVDNLNPLQMIPFVKDVVDIVNAKLTGEYRNATDMTYEGITKAAQFVAHIGKKITGENVTVSDYGLAKEGVQALSILSGVPVYNVWNDIEGIHNGFFDNWETKVQSPYKDFYKAIDNDGDIQQEVNNLKELGKDETTIKRQITNTYKQTYLDTTDMTEKANLKNKLIKAYTAAGDTREQAIKKIDKW